MSPTLPRGWECKELATIVDEERGISYGIVQPGAADPLGVPVVRVNNIKQNRIVTSEVLRVDRRVEANYSRTRLKGGEVLLTLVGTLGECAVVPDDLIGWNVARAVAVIPVKRGMDASWVAFSLRSPTLQHYMRAWATTTVQATLNLRDVARLPIPLPPAPERDLLSKVLRAFDDKIELNRRMSETLESFARALFKSWFVDFDAVRAKSEVRQPCRMDAETAALFPNCFEESPLGKIPRGWRVAPIGECVRVLGGSTPRTEEPLYWEGGIHHFATPKDLSQVSGPILIAAERLITDAGLRQIASGLLPSGTVLLSSRAPIGYTAIADIEVAVNQGIAAMVCDGPVPNYYAYCWAKDNLGTIIGHANGSTFLEISKGNFRKIKALRPDNKALEAFSRLVAPMFQQIANATKESKTLAAIRDALLRKLISGEVRIRDAERIGSSDLQ
jgi:type I restriction enzyme S subunit